MKATIRLPWPPSVNHYWRSVRIGRAVRVLISKAGRQYRKAVAAAVRERWPGLSVPTSHRLSVRISAVSPDRRSRDLDNLPKALFDALTHAGVWVDDSQIDFYSIERRGFARGGWVDLKIEVLNDATTLDQAPR